MLATATALAAEDLPIQYSVLSDATTADKRHSEFFVLAPFHLFSHESA
jgi:hypothetical protein